MREDTNRARQAIQTRTKILDIALNMIKEYGYDNIGIKQISEAAGVSTGAFYHHFQSKDGIIIAAYTECDNYFKTKVIGKLQADNFFDKILEYIDHQMIYAVEFGVELITQVYKAQINHGTNFFLSEVRTLPDGLNELIREAQLNNVIDKDIDSLDMALELLLISRGVIYNWCQMKGNYDLQLKCRNIIKRHLHCYFNNKN